MGAPEQNFSVTLRININDILEKWFPLQGERAQSLKVFKVRMLGFKNKIDEKEEIEQQQTYQFTTR